MPFPDGPLKEAIWETLIDIAIRHQRSRLLIAGDFNSCYPHEADSGRGYTVEPLRRMASVAVDVWREKVPAPSHRDQITWNGPNGLGNRIDFVFATKRLARDIISARHRHDVRERRISDHSAVVVDVRPVAKAQDARMVAVDRAL
jgi:endonuclease/exonuclease/phosphatase family metal-dependent hydrolase